MPCLFSCTYVSGCKPSFDLWLENGILWLAVGLCLLQLGLTLQCRVLYDMANEV